MTDQSALEAFLAEAAGASAARVVSDSQLTGGAIQDNRLLVVEFDGGRLAGRQELVLRRDAPSGVAVSHGKAEEFALLTAAFAAGVTVPEPLFLSLDRALGGPFYVMRKVEGEAQGHRLVREPALLGDGAAVAERLGEELGKIHGITPPCPDLDFLPLPEGSPALAAVAAYRSHLDALEWWDPALEWGLRWCELNAPPERELVLVHQDFRTGNYMVDGGRLTAVLDWEFCAWGDPMSDLGWFCAKCWRFGRDALEAGGIGPREAFYRGYRRVSGREIDHEAVAYWEVMAHLRWAVIALQQGQRHASGAEESLDLALTGRRAETLAWEILRLTPPERWSAAS
ncbi:MAG: phosphotransferase family protein [Kiloniellales bacterium]|nr:phosphotransferase family protein [Kiloniellales bacterium]